jgi:hypothetical protein
VDAAPGASHYSNYLGVVDDNLSPVLFDADGAITDAVLGAGNSSYILAFSAVQKVDFSSSRILEAEMVLNGKFIDGQPDSPGNPEISQQVFEGMVVHEAGHFAGLDHSQLNLSEAFDASAANDDVIPTMFPVNIHAGTSMEGASLHFDDRAALSALYPAANHAATSGVIEGTVFGYMPGVGYQGYQGANVVARKIGDSKLSAASSVSGYLFQDSTGAFGTTNVGFKGYYRIEGLPPGDYTVEVEPIDRRFRGENSVGPVNPPKEFGGIPEFWNGYNEGAVSHQGDPPAEQVVVPVSANRTATDIHFVLNWADGLYELFHPTNKPNDLDNTRFFFLPDQGAPGGYRVRRFTFSGSFPHNPANDVPVVLPDNGYVTWDFQATGLQFPIYGIPQTSLNLSSNGFITFGTPAPLIEADPTESILEHLSPRPHISALYEDLDPALGGRVSIGSDAVNLYITFEDVPLAGNAAATNSFQIALSTRGSIDLAYKNLAATSGLVGVSSGGQFTDNYLVSVDLTALQNDVANPAVTITSPANNSTVSGNVVINAGVTDPSPSSGIRSVEFFLDGGRIGIDTQAPYSMTWLTGRLTNGAKRLEVVATDNSGGRGSALSLVEVNNTGGPVLTHFISDVVESASAPTFTLNIRNDSTLDATELTLNRFWLEGRSTNGSLVRIYCNPTSGALLPRTFGTLSPGGTRSIQLHCQLPTNVAASTVRRWVDSGSAYFDGIPHTF